MIHKSLSYDWALFLVSLFNKDKSLEGIERDLLIYRIQLCYSWLDSDGLTQENEIPGVMALGHNPRCW